MARRRLSLSDEQPNIMRAVHIVEPDCDLASVGFIKMNIHRAAERLLPPLSKFLFLAKAKA